MWEPKTKCSYDFGGFRLIPGEELLLKEGEPVALTPKAFQTLALLVERRGHLVLKDELLTKVWGDAFVEEQAAAKTVSTIRSVLQEDPKDPQFIQTIPKRGYRFVGDVTEVELSESGIPLPAAPAFVEHPPRQRPLLVIGFAALAIVAVTVGLGWSFGGWFQPASRGTIRSITVLPFENVSGELENAFLVDGVTDSLTADLSRLSELSFIALPAEIRRGTAPADPKEIGTRLGVDAVLTGTVTRSGDQIRITAQLTQPATGKNLWANTYERMATDLQSLQKEVARSVAEEIRSSLPPKDLERLKVRRTAVPQAFEEYQRGRYYLNLQNPKDQDTAIAALERAVAIDPSFALAYTDLAQAYTWKHFSFSPGQTSELSEKAYIATEKAIELDPAMPEGYLARGRTLWTPENRFPHERAIQDYRKALDLDPKLDEARNQLALVYCHIGALDEALGQARAGVRLNPTNNLLHLRIGQSMNSLGRYEEALRELRSIPEKTHPSMIGHQIAWALLNLGRKDEALATVEGFLEKNKDLGGTFASIKAVIAALDGNNARAEELIKEALEKGKGYGHFHHTAYTIACAYAIMKRTDEAITYLEMASDTGFPCYPSYEIEPTLNNVRQDPQFISFMSRQKARWETIRRNSGL